MAEFSELISHLEKLEGPSGKLDDEIYKAFGGWTRTLASAPDGGMLDSTCWVRSGEFIEVRLGHSPAYTASPTEAMRLIPTGWDWWADYVSGRCVWSISPRAGKDERLVGRHAIPAIALCIASLKARLAHGD